MTGTTNYPQSIANKLESFGFFAGITPATDPEGRDFLVYRCEDRIAVFAQTNNAGPSTDDRNWWSNNACTTYPYQRGYNYIKLSAPLPSRDPARVEAVSSVVSALEAYADTNGTSQVLGAGWKGKGEGWYNMTGTNYPQSIANALASFFSGAVPNDPDGRDFLIYRCGNRIGLFADTDSAGGATTDRTWWNNNGCFTPTNGAYSYLDVSAEVAENDPTRISAAGVIVSALESYSNNNGTYTVTGSGWKGTGEGWFRLAGTNFEVSIASRLLGLGYLSGNGPVDPDGRDFLIYRCEDRIGVFANTNNAGSSTVDRNWWADNGCTDYPAGRGYGYLDLSAPIG